MRHKYTCVIILFWILDIPHLKTGITTTITTTWRVLKSIFAEQRLDAHHQKYKYESVGLASSKSMSAIHYCFGCCNWLDLGNELLRRDGTIDKWIMQ